MQRNTMKPQSLPGPGADSGRPAENLECGDKTCPHLWETLPHLKERYRRLALVSLPRHLRDLDIGDEETLVVSCNWLLWQEELATDRHCIHHEAFHDGYDPLDLGGEHYLRAADWLYLDDRDVTLFHGVSLGRKLIEETAQIITEWHRLVHGLEAAIKRYHPAEVVFFDFQSEISRLAPAERFHLVLEVATRLGVAVVDRRDPPAASGTDLPDKRHLVPAEARGDNDTTVVRAKNNLLSLFEMAMDRWSHLRRPRAGKRPAILILATHRTVLPLIQGSWRSKLVPILFARQFPDKKNVLLLLKSLARGHLLISNSCGRLTPSDQQAVDAIGERIEESWKQPVRGHELAVRNYLRREALANKRFYRLAEKVKSAESVLERYRPDAIFVDGMLNVDINIFLELAKTLGIPTASTWHSPMIQRSKLPVFGTDPRAATVVDRCLTWGEAHEDWLKDIGARCKLSRIGWLANRVRRKTTPAPVRGGRALILQFVVAGEDFAARSANEYACFVHVARMLRELGCEGVRLKLHPSRSVTTYYERISRFFKIECEIFQEGPVDEHLDWADFVVGPIYTAAMLETMVRDKPYFPVHFDPSSLDPSLVKKCRVYCNLDSLRQALHAGTTGDQSETLNYFTSDGEDLDPVDRTWTTLYDMAIAHAHSPDVPRP